MWLTYRGHAYKALGHISNNDTDEEEDGGEPVVAQTEADSQEDDANSNSEWHENVHYVLHLLSQGRLRGVHTVCKRCYATNHCVRTHPHHNAAGNAYNVIDPCMIDWLIHL